MIQTCPHARQDQVIALNGDRTGRNIGLFRAGMILVRPRARFENRVFVRLKITKQLAGSIDGRHLGRFEVGEVYDVGTTLANYLLAMGAAEPVPEERPADEAPDPHELLNELRRRLSGGDPSGPEKATDRRRRTPKRR